MEKQTSDMKLSLIVLGAIACLFLFKILSPFMESSTKSPGELPPATTSPIQKLTRSDAEWRKFLTAEQYIVMRQDQTEPAFSGAFVNFNEKGTYLCAGCNLPVFSSNDKIDTKTGWATFTRPFSAENVIHKYEGMWSWKSVTVHCARCDSHLGTMASNGTPPTGRLYSINSVSLKFEPASPEKP